MEKMIVNGEEKPIIENVDEIVNFARGLYKVAHYSNDTRECVKAAILNSMGDLRFNQIVTFFQVTKNDYIDNIHDLLLKRLEQEKQEEIEKENKWRESVWGK